MKWRKRGKKEAKKSGKRETQPKVFTVALFRTLSHAPLFFFISTRIACRIPFFFFRFFTLFVLLIEKGKKTGQKTVNNPIPKYRKYRFTRS
jgi:hypothetical protein